MADKKDKKKGFFDFLKNKNVEKLKKIGVDRSGKKLSDKDKFVSKSSSSGGKGDSYEKRKRFVAGLSEEEREERRKKIAAQAADYKDGGVVSCDKFSKIKDMFKKKKK